MQALLAAHVDSGDDWVPPAEQQEAEAAEAAAAAAAAASDAAKKATSDGDGDWALRAVVLRAFEYIQLSATEGRNEMPGSSYMDRLAELFRRHPRLMLSCDRHGVPMVVWAARCRSRDALAAVLNAGAAIKTEYAASFTLP